MIYRTTACNRPRAEGYLNYYTYHRSAQVLKRLRIPIILTLLLAESVDGYGNTKIEAKEF